MRISQEHKRRARLIFLLSALFVAIYVAVWHSTHSSSMAGMLFTFGSMPWSLPWLQVEHELSSWPWPIRNAITQLAICLGFGVNAALTYLAAAILRGYVSSHSLPKKV